MLKLEPIANIRSDFPTKFGIPRQSGLVGDPRASIIFTEPYRKPEALRELESFSHIWLLWGFSEACRSSWSPTVRPPRLGGNVRVGVFASRSPYRPDPIGLSSVKLDLIELETPDGPVIHVLGADLMNRTPIYDIKPYIPGDCHPQAAAGFTRSLEDAPLQVADSEKYLEPLPPEDAAVIRSLLSYDPRPGYHHDPDRIYGMEYKDFEIKFSVRGSLLTVRGVCRRTQEQ